MSHYNNNHNHNNNNFNNFNKKQSGFIKKEDLAKKMCGTPIPKESKPQKDSYSMPLTGKCLTEEEQLEKIVEMLQLFEADPADIEFLKATFYDD